MRYPTFSQIAIGEPDANSEFLSALRTQERPVFLQNFLTLPHFPIEDFTTGRKFLIYGQKGTGKTSALRHLQDIDTSAIKEFVIFKKSLLEEVDIQDFAKIPLVLDEEEIKSFKHYHHTVKRLIIFLIFNKYLSNETIADLTKSNLDQESKSLVQKLFGSSIADAMRFAFDSASDVFHSVGLDIDKISSGKALLDGGKILKRNNDSILNYFIKTFKSKPKKIRIYIDEIHFAYRSKDSLQQDALLVRDTILAAQNLNERFAEEGIDVVIYLAVRSEYLDHPIISTADITHSLESVGHEITYSNFPFSKSHPLFDLVFLRFKKAIGDSFTKQKFFDVYMSGIDPVVFLERTWAKPRDIVRFFKAAKTLYPQKSSLTLPESNAVWRRYSQESWKDIRSSASPFLSPGALSLFDETISRITPALLNGTKRYLFKEFSELFRPVYDAAKDNQANFYDFDHFMRLLYIIGIFATRNSDADQDIYHSYHRGNRNYHAGGQILVHPTVLKAFG